MLESIPVPESMPIPVPETDMAVYHVMTMPRPETDMVAPSIMPMLTPKP